MAMGEQLYTASTPSPTGEGFCMSKIIIDTLCFIEIRKIHYPKNDAQILSLPRWGSEAAVR